MSKGIIYIATGEKYIAEAMVSAKSVKQNSPGIEITLFADRDVSESCFDKKIVIEDPYYSNLDKVICMMKSPYTQTLFLDTDTYVCDDLAELFQLLEKFDLALAHAPIRSFLLKNNHPIDDEFEKIPSSFPEMNTGVILFKKSPNTDRVLANWLTFHKQYIHCQKQLNNTVGIHDQPSLRRAIYNSESRIAILTPEYNCRLIFPTFIYDKVKIIHCRTANFPRLAQKINQKIGSRIYLPELKLVIPASKWLKLFNLSNFPLLLHKLIKKRVSKP